MRKALLIFVFTICLILSACHKNDVFVPPDEGSEAISRATNSEPCELNFVVDTGLKSSHAGELMQMLENWLLETEDVDGMYKEYGAIPLCVEAYWYDDFDRDGYAEMFVDVGRVIGKTHYFISDAGVYEVEAFGIEKPSESYAISIGNKTFMLYEESQNGTYFPRFYMYGVRDGHYFKTNISGAVGIQRELNKNSELILLDKYYDGNTLGAGYTIKPQYYYCEDGDIWEYGGIEITMNELLLLPNAETVLNDLLPSEVDITEIYYRENGVININYQIGNGEIRNNENIVLRYDGNRVIKEEKYPESTDGGHYEATRYPDIATYPDAFPIGVE